MEELRFYCYELSPSGDNTFYSFKTKNQQVISVAFDQNQRVLNNESFSQKFIIDMPEGAFNSNSKVDKSDHFIDFVGQDRQGGFFSTLFGTTANKSYWTVIGSEPSSPLFECGNSHANHYSERVVLDSDAPQVQTLHNVWFRGHPPTKEQARQRIINKINNEASAINKKK